MAVAFRKSRKVNLLILVVLGIVLIVSSCSKEEYKKSPTSPQDTVDLVNVASGWGRWEPEETVSVPSSSDDTSTPLPENVYVSESLRDGVTVGTFDDATLKPEGLQLHGGTGFIRYNVPTLSRGYVEFNAKGFEHNELHGGSEFKAVLLTMWGGNEGYIYETAAYIYELRKFGYIDGRPDASNCLEVRMITNHDWNHGARYIHDWDPNTTYRFRVEWGDGVTTVYRDGEMAAITAYNGEFAPSSHMIQIGANAVSPYSHRHKESPHNLLISEVVIGAL